MVNEYYILPNDDPRINGEYLNYQKNLEQKLNNTITLPFVFNNKKNTYSNFAYSKDGSKLAIIIKNDNRTNFELLLYIPNIYEVEYAQKLNAFITKQNYHQFLLHDERNILYKLFGNLSFLRLNQDTNNIYFLTENQLLLTSLDRKTFIFIKLNESNKYNGENDTQNNDDSENSDNLIVKYVEDIMKKIKKNYFDMNLKLSSVNKNIDNLLNNSIPKNIYMDLSSYSFGKNFYLLVDHNKIILIFYIENNTDQKQYILLFFLNYKYTNNKSFPLSVEEDQKMTLEFCIGHNIKENNILSITSKIKSGYLIICLSFNDEHFQIVLIDMQLRLFKKYVSKIFFVPTKRKGNITVITDLFIYEKYCFIIFDFYYLIIFDLITLNIIQIIDYNEVDGETEMECLNTKKLFPKEYNKCIYMDFIKVPEKQSIIVKKKSTRIFCNQKMPISSDPWEDDLFPPCKNSLCPNDENGFIQFTHLKEDDIDGWEYYDWCRVNELIENYNIFEDGADLDDIIQGDIADCYFLSALGSLCSYPEFFNKLMFSDQASENNFYGIYLYLNGKWKLVLLDDYFPYKVGTIKEMCFSRSIQNEIWVSLVEKAWAKVNGCYARIGCGGYSYEAFDVLTEAFTEEISIIQSKENEKIEELWEKMDNAFKKNYILTAGTPSISKVTEVGLVMGHAYTLVKVYKVNTDFGEERLVKLKNPYRDEEFTGDWSDNSDLWTDEIKDQCEFPSNDNEEEDKDGIFYMSFNDFIEYFCDIDIAKVETGYQSTYYKIKKKYATKCQIIKIEVKQDNPNTYIQLYQKNPRILRKNGTYYPKMVMAFLVLLDENFQYINSASGVDMHMAIEADLKKGTYYILCDINYRNQTKDFKTYGYTVSFYSKNLITTIENVTNKIDTVSKLENAMINYCKKTIEPKADDSGINIYDNETNKELPFRVFCFDNPTNDSFKVKFDVNFKGLKNFCFYNDSIASEFDSSVIKEINSKSATAILIMGYTKDYVIDHEYKILSSSDQSTYENTHPVFNCNKKGFDEKGCLFSYELVVDNGEGFIIGLENISNDNFKLKLKLSETYCIDTKYQGKENIEFDILSQSKKVFNLRVKPEGKNPSFTFEEIK